MVDFSLGRPALAVEEHREGDSGPREPEGGQPLVVDRHRRYDDGDRCQPNRQPDNRLSRGVDKCAR